MARSSQQCAWVETFRYVVRVRGTYLTFRVRGSSLGTRGSVDNSKFEFKPGDATVRINETESTCQINC